MLGDNSINQLAFLYISREDFALLEVIDELVYFV
jgi:hypothetical protein